MFVLFFRFFACEALHVAAYRGHSEVLEVLLAGGAVANGGSNNEAWPAFAFWVIWLWVKT